MKKTVSSLLIATMSLCSVSAFAQAKTQECNNDCKKECTTECAKPEKCRKGDKKTCNPFEGLNLTEQQQAALKAIPCPREVMKASRQQCKDNKTECNKADRRKMSKDIKLNYLKQVKSVLTPEQYVQFLENNFVNQGFHKAGRNHGNRHHNKHKKCGNERKYCSEKQNCNK